MKLLWLLLALGGAAPALTLEEALREAATKHPLLEVARARVDAAGGRVTQAGLRPNPLFIYQTEDFRTWGSPGHRFWHDADHFFYLQQTFETAAKRARRVDVARALEARSAIELALQRQSIVARVRSAYWDARGAQERVTLLDAQLKALDELTNYHRIQVQEGAMAEADLLRVELEEEKLRQVLGAAQMEAEKQRIRLARELGRSQMSEFALDTPLDAKVKVPALALEKALAQRAEARLAQQVLRLSRSQADLETALATPNIDGVAGYKRSREFDTVIWGIQVPLPLNNKNEGNIAAARAETRVAENAVASTEALLRAEFAGAEREAEQRRRQVDRLAPLRERARENARIAQASYRLGGADLLRLLDAQRAQLETEQTYLDAVIGLHQALAQLEAAAGEMP